MLNPQNVMSSTTPMIMHYSYERELISSSSYLDSHETLIACRANRNRQHSKLQAHSSSDNLDPEASASFALCLIQGKCPRLM